MDSYSEQLKEVFIRPIRSVLIVDDRFPTLDSFLKIELSRTTELAASPQMATPGGSSLPEQAEHARLSALLAFCRDKRRQWLVDVHDGKDLADPNNLPFSSLRQCDLLVLDYNLDGDNMDGSQAIEIIRQLAHSDNFNLAIVYTSQDIQDVFEEIGVSLSSEIRRLQNISESDKRKIESALDVAEDADTGIRSKLARLITHKVCIELQQNGISTRNPKNKDLLAPLLSVLSMVPFSDGKLNDLLLKKLLADFVARQAPGVTFDVTLPKFGSAAKWLIAGNAFVVVVSKVDVPPTDLIDHLMKAIEEWKPSPNRLIFAKLRATLEASGLAPEKGIFQDRPLQAFWLLNLLQTAEHERPYYIGSLLDRQMEMLTDSLRTKVTEFTQRVVATSLAGGGDAVQIAKDFWSVDPLDEQKRSLGLISHNTHVSTKDPRGKNLVPGHVLQIGTRNPEYWICLSPACDLEAGRNGGRDFKKRVHPWMPFTALRLHKISSPADALKLATRGWVLFLTIGDRKQQFSYFKDADPNRSPVWEEFLARKEGRLINGFELEVARVDKVSGNDSDADATLLPTYLCCKASIVAQLRSEYASSLTLRLASHLSRIGLDYMGSGLPVVG